MKYIPRVGDLLEGPSGERVLVGDINPNGGVCDDCFEAPWSRNFLEHTDGFVCLLPDGWHLVRNVLEP